MSQRDKRRTSLLCDGILLALLALLLLGALTFDRSTWPSLVGDESTYLMAAESLAWDGDLLYERGDFERFVGHWQQRPEGLVLQSGDGGKHITYGKPFFYSLLISPLVRLSPMRGPFVANALLLALAAWMASRTLKRRIGPSAAIWVSSFLFASVVFAYTFWAHADLFLLALVAIAFSLAYREPDGVSEGRAAALSRPAGGWQPTVRWAVVGALLAVVVFSRPLYLPMFLPAFLALPRRRRTAAAAALVLGALALAVSAAAVHRVNAQAWTSYGAQRRGFYTATGYPEVDFPADEWRQSVDQLGDAAWAEARNLWSVPASDSALWMWNALYFVGGRHVGVLPYFLPLLLGLVGRPKGMSRWALVVAVALSTVGFFLYRPFNFYGGGGAIANRYFLPLFPAFWFLVARALRPRYLVLTAVVAAPFLWPLWSAPRAYPLRSNHTYRYVSQMAERVLPYETTQSHLKPGGRSDVVHAGLWIKFLSPTLRSRADGSALLLDRGRRGQFLIGANRPIARLKLRILGEPDAALRVGGALVVAEKELLHRRVLTLEFDKPRARHPMWWTWDDVYLYQLTLRSEASGESRLAFTLSRSSDARREGS